MADRPIIFSAPMVQALLAGRKTQTRRELKPQPVWDNGALGIEDSAGGWIFCANTERGFAEGLPRSRFKMPYAPGDRLYVREAWSGSYAMSFVKPKDRAPFTAVWWWADGNPPHGDWEKPRPSIHMPRWASRLTLHVTEVRVQRLQEISEADAVAEGIAPLFTDAEKEAYPECRGDSWRNYLWHGRHDARPSWIDAWEHQYSSYEDARGSFSSLWASIHGPDAWASNPWVCAITFTVERANIDEARHA